MFPELREQRRMITVGQRRCRLVDNFHLSAGNLRTLGYGKTRPKNPSDLNAPENRRVEVVNLAAQAQASR
jgi:flagellar motor protein MotB